MERSTRRRAGLFCLCFTLAAASHAQVESALDGEKIMRRMESAYAAVQDYQARMEVRSYTRDGSVTTDRFLYTFKKPGWIRLDFESPHAGTVLIYPDKNGKAAIRPSGLARFLELHLPPDNPLLRVSAGQPVNKTDMGLLIKNISHSLTDQSRGPVEISETEENVMIRVLALNHFREGVVSLYRFIIDKRLWLPIKVEESSPDGFLERTATFETLDINPDVPDAFFQLDGRKNGGKELESAQ
jgi:outer membrane lipoprotein-sorting protein